MKNIFEANILIELKSIFLLCMYRVNILKLHVMFYYDGVINLWKTLHTYTWLSHWIYVLVSDIYKICRCARMRKIDQSHFYMQK